MLNKLYATEMIPARGALSLPAIQPKETPPKRNTWRGFNQLMGVAPTKQALFAKAALRWTYQVRVQAL